MNHIPEYKMKETDEPMNRVAEHALIFISLPVKLDELQVTNWKLALLLKACDSESKVDVSLARGDAKRDQVSTLMTDGP